MKKLRDHTVIKETETEIVQERIHLLPNGQKISVKIHGNPNPDKEERKKNLDRLGDIITECCRQAAIRKATVN